MKAGVDANLVNSAGPLRPRLERHLPFDSLADYLARAPAQYTQFAGSGALDTHKHQIAFYVQDEWRVPPGFTLSPGFRYEMALLARLPAGDRAAEPPPARDRASRMTRSMIGPRLGMAWDTRRDGKTVCAPPRACSTRRRTSRCSSRPSSATAATRS